MSTSTAPAFYWHPATSRASNVYVAFRIAFELSEAQEVELHLFGAHWFQCWLNGEYLTEGPVRFEPAHPEYEELIRNLPAGKHLVTAVVHNVGLNMRMLRGDQIPPFLYLRTWAAGGVLPSTWKCLELEGYQHVNVRINPQLSWIEWCDHSRNPAGWMSPGFDDSSWHTPIPVDTKFTGPLRVQMIGSVGRFTLKPTLLNKGLLESDFYFSAGGSGEDLAWGFHSRELQPTPEKANGVWRRYDLGYVCLCASKFELELPAGCGVEFAYAERLTNGRVSPYIPLSCGPCTNLDHYVARGGIEEFGPVTPRGGRFLEIQVSAPPDKVKFLKEESNAALLFW